MSFLENIRQNMQAGLVNTNVDATLSMDQSKKYNKTVDSRIFSDSRQYAPVDARQFSFIYNSPNASNTQRNSATGATSTPTISPRMSDSTDFGETSATPTVAPSLFGGGGSGVSTLLVIGAAVVGGVVLLSAAKGGKK